MKNLKMECLTLEVLDKSTRIGTASLGLLAIASLLGADGQDHNIEEDLRKGLVYAVKALATSIQNDSNDLYFFADEGAAQ